MRRLTWMHGLVIAGWVLGPGLAVAAVSCGSSGNGGQGGTGGSGGSTASTGGSDGGVGGSTEAGADGGDGGMKGLTCAKLLTCDQPCNSDACTNACYAEATGVAQGLFDALTDCIDENCSSADGGPCADPSSAACSSCNEMAATGACITDLQACENDSFMGPPDPDGGGVVMPNTDAGMELNCGEYIACVGACTDDGGPCTTTCDDQATPEARALAGVLNACLAVACPSTDGGPCEMQGTTCSGCISQAELAFPDTCATPFNTCESDTSNAPDASAAPTSLVDGGTLSTLVSGLSQPASTLVVQGGYLYFTEVIGDSPVKRLELASGAVTTLGPNQPTPVGLAVDANNVYVWSVGTFSGVSSLNNDDGTVVQIPIGGGTPITLGQDIEVEYDAPYVNSVTVDAKNVYWVAGANGNDGAIMSTPIGSATPTALYTNLEIPEAVVSDGTNLYWADWGTFDANGHSNNDGTLMQGPVTGGTPIVLASGLSAPTAIAVDAHNVYWTNVGSLGGDNLPAPNTGAVMQVPIGGGQVVTLASAQPIPVGIAVAGQTVYWVQYSLSFPGLIVSTPVGGGALVPLVSGLPDPFDMTISGDTLYWSNGPSSPASGTIQSLSPF